MLTPGRTNAILPAFSSAVEFWTASDAMLNGDKTTSFEKIPFTKAASLEETLVLTVLPAAFVAVRVKMGITKGSIFSLQRVLAIEPAAK